MPYGWTGTDLEVDLSQGKTEKKETDGKLHETYLGGKGTNAKILWDRVPPEVASFSPDNLLIIGTGILTGTIVPGANRATITCKSPVTNMHSYPNLGGFFGSELKHAGYDTIIISGKSPTPVYLWINDDRIELRDAGHLWGKDTHETRRLIQEELGIDKVKTICIGPAGENKVYAASIEHSNGDSASRGGGGAIMGDKNLKAIAVRGTKDVSIANPSKLIEMCEQILSRTDKQRTTIIEPYVQAVVGPFIQLVGAFDNFGEPASPQLRQEIGKLGEMGQKFVDRMRTREVACYNCGLRCKHAYPSPDGGYCFAKCGAFIFPIIATKIINWNSDIAFYSLCEEYGLDVCSVASCVAFAIDLYERGILTKEDTEGMHLEWGNAEAALSLVEKIARREGIGDVLANGVYQAALQIGKGAEEYAYHTKKLEMRLFEMRGARDTLASAVSDNADYAKLVTAGIPGIWVRPKEAREAYIESGFFPYPKEFEEYFLAGVDYTGADYEGVCQFGSYDDEAFTLADLTGLCYFWVLYYPYAPINGRALIADLISCVTGMSIDEVEATKIARRIVSLVRAYNVREGIRRKDDTLPEKFFHRPLVQPYHNLDHDLFNKWIDRWYELKGWNSQGIPTKATLEELGLDYIRQDLERRGILTG